MIDDFRPAPSRTKSLQENTNNLKAETEFATPAQVAADDVVTSPLQTPVDRETAPTAMAPEYTAFTPPAKAEGRMARLRQAWPPTKKQALIGLAVFLAIAVSGAGIAFLMPDKPAPVAAKPVVKVKKEVPKPVVPTTVASSLSGLQVDPALNAKPVTAVIIENSPNARPQSGLAPAGVVFEAIAEGGITRFLALYQDTNPADVGPIRSVRPYYLHWAMGFDAAIAHVGGSPEALTNIKQWGTRDLDQFFNSSVYRRSGDRYAPHNVYSNVDALTQLSQAKGFTSSTFTPWLRKADAPSAQVSARSIDMAISGPAYNTRYDYDPATNSYKRSMAGTPHLDVNGSQQISPKVVIGLVMPYSIQADGKHSVYGTVGAGPAYIFQDGILTVGQWNKAEIKAPIIFTDPTGKHIAINAGQTWLTAVPTAAKITSAP